jgi:hypothetical protein
MPSHVHLTIEILSDQEIMFYSRFASMCHYAFVGVKLCLFLFLPVETELNGD